MTSTSPATLQEDLLINGADEVRVRQDLALLALGKRKADRSLSVGRLLDIHTREWLEDQEIVMRGRRIAWVGSAGTFAGEVAQRVDASHLSAVPGFGDVHNQRPGDAKDALLVPKNKQMER